jgi:hypothetical protein
VSAARPERDGVSEEDLARLRKLEADLEKGLAGGDPISAGPPSQKAPGRTPVPLVAEPVAPVAMPSAEETVFGAKPDDYYPTVRPVGKGAGGAKSATEPSPRA